MRCVLFVLTYLHLTKMVSSKINYCGAKMCANSDTHTFCQYTDTPGPQCTGYMPAPLTKAEKINIVMRLNQRRNDAALGLLGHLPSAGDMLTMSKEIDHLISMGDERRIELSTLCDTVLWASTGRRDSYHQAHDLLVSSLCHVKKIICIFWYQRWVEELAREAQLWANQCSPPGFPEEHDICRDLYSIPVGQNVASVVGEAPGLRVESMVDLWYMQGRHYVGNITSYTPPPYNNSYYGDFAQMLWSPTFMVGCARSRFMAIWHGRPRTVERLVCNMAPRGPRTERPMWTPAPPATLCPPRSSPAKQHAGLCTLYNIQKFDDKKNKTSLEYTVLLSALLEIETNYSADIVGNLDEIYLTKLAAVTMEQLNKKSRKEHLKSLEEITRKLGVSLRDYNDVIIHRIARERRKIRRYMGKPKRKLKFIGRPKPYNLHELSKEEDKTIMQNTNFVGKTLKIEKEEENLQIVVTDDNKENLLLDRRKIKPENSNERKTEDDSKEQTLYNISSMLDNNISNDEDDVEISDKIIQDYFSDPETVREIQESLLRMEQAIGNHSTDTFTPPNPVYFTPAKVRRELRSTESEEFKLFKMELERTRKPRKSMMENDEYETNPYKNKVVLPEKDSLVQSLFKFLPNIRTFGIGTESGISATCRTVPTISTLISSFYTAILLI